MALEADDNISQEALKPIELTLLIIYNVEILAKFVCEGPRLFSLEGYNILDSVILIACDVNEFVMQSEDDGLFIVFRMVRSFRLTRLFTKFQQLEKIIAAFVSGMQDVAWILVLCLLALFMCGIFCTLWLSKNEDLPLEYRQEFFPSVGVSMLSLFRVMTLDWWEVVHPAGVGVPMSYIFMLAFTVVMGLGMMGLFGAVFVDSLMAAKADEERAAEKQFAEAKRGLKEDVSALLKASDEDNSGAMSAEELIRALEVLEGQDEDEANPEWREWRMELKEKRAICGLTKDSWRSAFDLAIVGKQEVSYKEVLDTVFSLDDAATRRDSWSLLQNMLQTRQTSDLMWRNEMKTWIQQLQNNQHNVDRKLDHLLAHLGVPPPPPEPVPWYAKVTKGRKAWEMMQTSLKSADPQAGQETETDARESAHDRSQGPPRSRQRHRQEWEMGRQRRRRSIPLGTHRRSGNNMMRELCC